MKQRMKLNLRTLLVIVILITSLSVIYNNIITQTLLILFSIALLLGINPSRHKFKRIMHRSHTDGFPDSVPAWWRNLLAIWHY
jgi:energy-coupling factor transporter transmembrane protein EcfT